MIREFYDQLSPYYHLLYPDWDQSIARQSRGLAAVLEEFGVAAGSPILDAACGIGTQTLGLAQLGYVMTASDLAPAAVQRARTEAAQRGLTVSFAVADVRRLSHVLAGPFAAVLACDNAVPHLLSDDDIRIAFVECRRLLVSNGILVISVRDYAAIDRRRPDVRSYGSRTEGECRYSAEQVWEWDADQYTLMLRLTEQCGSGAPLIREFTTRYYAVTLVTLERLLHVAGFGTVVRRDERFFQPLLVAVNTPAS
ncbi:MAG TPA: class I SAM-dependent methyltransferase [Gemmatimonadaceae bacterium]|jgi:SAM-dependent methyltransferase